MSYLSGRHMSCDDYYRSANYVSDSEHDVIERGEDVEGDALLAGDHGGRGIGLAGGYSGSQSSRQPPSTTTTAPDLELAGAGDDPYAGYDPGMAGCTVEPSTCIIPGVPWMGTSPPGSPTHPHSYAHILATSRGYERDEDEYAESFTSSTSSARGPGVAEPGPGPALAPVPAPVSVPVPAVDPNPLTDPKPEPERPHTPPLGTRLVGRVERLAGKVLRDPDIQARGKRHMVSPRL